MPKFKLPTLLLLLTLSASTTLLAQHSATNAVNLYAQNVVLTRPSDSTDINSKSVFKKGKEPIVIAFWLTTCQPCMREFDAYVREYSNWKQQVSFKMVGISIDFPNRFQRINEIAREKKLPFEVYWDRNRSFKEILPGELNGLPQVFVFSPDGQLVWQHKGFLPGDEKEVFRQISLYQQR